MAVFRIEKTRDYTVMSNHHLKNKELSLKAKGLLSQMLSLPEDWDYTLAGLSIINKEKIDAIREAVRELERAGYISRARERDEKGRLRGTEYVIHEIPQPMLEKPTLENPTLEKPTLENPTQLNTKELNTKESNTYLFSSDDRKPNRNEGKGSEKSERLYRELISENIELEILLADYPYDRKLIEEIVELMVEVVVSNRKTIRVSGSDMDHELVKARFLKLTGEHIRFAIDCLKENTTKIKNIKQYMLAILYNAPTTITAYYAAKVQHDAYGETYEDYEY